MPKDAYEIYLQKLNERLNVAATEATPLALAGDYAAAEHIIRNIDSDIYGTLAIARMYIAAISSLGGMNALPEDQERIRTMFERAVAFRENAYPTPHTECEALSYAEGQSQDRSRVIQEIGFDPANWH